MPTDPDWSGGTVLCDERTRTVDASPDVLSTGPSGRSAATRGWYSGEWLWTHPGPDGQARRRRRDAPRAGAARRAAGRRPARLLAGRGARAGPAAALRAEMKLPGEAWLEWRIDPTAPAAASSSAPASRRGDLGPRVLVLAPALPRRHLQTDGPPHRRGGGPAAWRGTEATPASQQAPNRDGGLRMTVRGRATPSRSSAPRSTGSRRQRRCGPRGDRRGRIGHDHPAVEGHRALPEVGIDDHGVDRRQVDRSDQLHAAHREVGDAHRLAPATRRPPWIRRTTAGRSTSTRTWRRRCCTRTGSIMLSDSAVRSDCPTTLLNQQ